MTHMLSRAFLPRPLDLRILPPQCPDMGHVLERKQLVRRPRSEVFAFFADAANLEALTPPFLGFQTLTPPPISMHAGTLIEYKIRLFGVGLRWQTLIESFEPDHRFVDVQLRGPYRSWRHEHEFVTVSEGTLIKDRVTYEMPLGWLGEIGLVLLVNRTLDKIFEFRRHAIARLEK